MDFTNEIKQLITSYLKHTEMLFTILEEEKAALCQQNEEILAVIETNKQQLLAECRQYDERLNALFKTQKLPLELRDLWQQVVLMLDICRCQNSINTSIIHSRLYSRRHFGHPWRGAFAKKQNVGPGSQNDTKMCEELLA